MRLSNPAPDHILPALYVASSPALRSWLDKRPKEVERVLARARVASAGRSLGKRDVGQKIGGARKDIAELRRVEQLVQLEALGAGAAYKAVTKAAVLGDFDVHASKAAGDSAGCAYAKRELWYSVQARPEDSSAARRAFVDGCALVRQLVADSRTVDELYAALDKLGRSSHPYGSEVHQWLTRDEFEAKFPEGPERMRRVQALGFSGYGYFSDNRVGFTKRPDLKVVEANAAMIAALGPRFYGAVFGHSKGSRSRERVAFHTDIKSRARSYEHLNDWSWSEAAESPEGQPKKRDAFVFVRAGLTGARQGGPDVGAPTGKQLQETFHLRGVEHGIWMSDSDADTGERSAYGALLDLSLVLGLPKPAMGLLGRLGLALGARGGGFGAAHYEPAYRVINLTKTQGAGTLAHEWGHALDHYLGDPTGKSGRAAYMSHGASCGIPGVDAAFRAVMQTIIGQGDLSAVAATRKRNPSGTEALVDVSTPITDHKDRDRRVVALNAWLEDIKKRRRAAAPGSEEHIEAQNEAHRHSLAVDAFKKLDRAFRAAETGAIRARQTERKTAGLTKFAKDAALLGEYWSRPQELFARAWEAAIEDMLVERGWVSGYLVTGTRVGYSILRKNARGEQVPCEVYPQGAEREVITGAMKGLVHALSSNWR